MIDPAELSTPTPSCGQLGVPTAISPILSGVPDRLDKGRPPREGGGLSAVPLRQPSDSRLARLPKPKAIAPFASDRGGWLARPAGDCRGRYRGLADSIAYRGLADSIAVRDLLGMARQTGPRPPAPQQERQRERLLRPSFRGMLIGPDPRCGSIPAPRSREQPAKPRTATPGIKPVPRPSGSPRHSAAHPPTDRLKPGRCLFPAIR